MKIAFMAIVIVIVMMTQLGYADTDTKVVTLLEEIVMLLKHGAYDIKFMPVLDEDEMYMYVLDGKIEYERGEHDEND